MKALYRFDTQFPEPSIRRAETDEICRKLKQGFAVALVGGHGMGKSSFLQVTKNELEKSSDTHVCLIREPAHPRTHHIFSESLARALGVTASETLMLILEAWYQQNPDRKLVLIFDELDRYADTPEDSQAGRDFFNELEEACQNLVVRPGILGAGGVGIYLLGNAALGSSFMRRTEQHLLTPFSKIELQKFAVPLAARLGMSDDSGEFESLIEETRVLTGGHPQLAARLFQEILDAFKEKGQIPNTKEVMSRFLEDFPDFCDDVHRGAGLRNPTLGTSRLLAKLQCTATPLGRSAIEQELKECVLSPDKAIRVLLASGLIHVEGKRRADPLHASVIPSVLSFPESKGGRPTLSSLREQLRFDLKRILQFINICAPDFFHGGKEERRLVEEATFSATIGMGLHMSGWEDVKRETQRVMGRVDLWQRYFGFEGHAIIEIKRWDNKDKSEIHEQVTGYANSDTAARATVMIVSARRGITREKYESECLKDIDFSPPEIKDEWMFWEVGKVDHFVVKVPSLG